MQDSGRKSPSSHFKPFTENVKEKVKAFPKKMEVFPEKTEEFLKKAEVFSLKMDMEKFKLRTFALDSERSSLKWFITDIAP